MFTRIASIVDGVRLVLAAIAMFSGLLPAAAAAQSTSGAAPAPSDVIVRFSPGADAKQRGEARSDADVRREAVLPLPGAELVDPEPGVTVGEAVRALERDPDVLYAEPNASRVAFAAPDDRHFALQWGLQNTGQIILGASGTPGADIDALAAWELTTGSRDIVVGIIDSGASTAHPDLAANVWRNPGESAAPANGRDDDRNGFVDDLNGWDFADRDAQPLDANGHGTHVAGTAGAQGGNSIGVTGVNWAGSLMVLRSLGADGAGTVADVLEGYDYAARNGARVVNVSLGGTEFSRAERDSLAAAGDLLVLAAAGNDGADNDVTGSFPCNYELANVICVGASDRDDQLAAFSNRGKRTVDLVAPGVKIASTWLDGSYAYLDGTSMATPHVTGVAALALSRVPGLTVAQLRDVLLASVDPVPALQAVTVTGGRLNAAAAVRAALAVPGADVPPTKPSATQPETTVDPQPTPSASTPPPSTSAPEPVAPTGTVSPPPPPPPPGIAVRDRVGPRLSLRAGRAVRVRSVGAKGLRASVGCSEACRFTVTLTLDPAAARKLGLRARQIALVRRGLTRADRRVVVLRPAAAVLRRLRGGGRAVLRVSAADAAGNRSARTQVITLRP